MASGLDEEKERMILDALKPIADILGKAHEYDYFARRHENWLKFLASKDYDASKELEELTSHFPSWARETFPKLRILYEKAYQKGLHEARKD